MLFPIEGWKVETITMDDKIDHFLGTSLITCYLFVSFCRDNSQMGLFLIPVSKGVIPLNLNLVVAM